jgi:hypothetical protein
MQVIENFFFTPIRAANILVTDFSSLPAVHGSLSKQRSPFASQDVLIEIEHRLQKHGY